MTILFDRCIGGAMIRSVLTVIVSVTVTLIIVNYEGLSLRIDNYLCSFDNCSYPQTTSVLGIQENPEKYAGLPISSLGIIHVSHEQPDLPPIIHHSEFFSKDLMIGSIQVVQVSEACDDALEYFHMQSVRFRGVVSRDGLYIRELTALLVEEDEFTGQLPADPEAVGIRVSQYPRYISCGWFNG